MKTKNKILTMAFTLLTFLSFGVINVNAATIAVSSKEDYLALLGNSEITTEDSTIRLEDDITIGNTDSSNSLGIRHNVTLDLNGHTMTLNWKPIKVWFYASDKTFTIIDSSNAKTGQLVKASGDQYSISLWQYSSGTPLITNNKLIIDGITYINQTTDNSDTRNILSENTPSADQTIAILLKNSNFVVNGALVDIQGMTTTKDYWNIEIENSTIRKTSPVRIGMSYAYSGNNKNQDFIDTTKSEIYRNGTLLDNSATVDFDYDTNLIEIKNKQRFDITAPTFTATGEGYESIAAKQISIAAVGDNRSIRSVQVSGNDFTIVAGPIGDTPVNVGTPNTAFTIKPKDNLKYGVHNALIRVTDTVGNVYFAEVSFEVNAYAETQIVTNEADLRKFTDYTSRDFPVVKTIKLGDDITLDDWLGIYALEEKTLDLNGHTLTTNDIITVVYGSDNTRSYSTSTFNLIDSSDGRTGAIATTNDTSFNLFRISEQYAAHDGTQLTYNFNLDGGTYSALNSRAGIFGFNFYYDWDNNAANRLNFNVKNATFNLNPNKESNLIYLPSEYDTSNDLKINLEDITVNLKAQLSKLISDKIEYTVGDIIPETQEFVYPNVVDGVVTGTNTAARTDIASNIRLSYINISEPVAQMKIQSIKRFDVVAPTFATVTEDYGTVAAAPITITAVGGTKTIQNVAVSGSDFYVDGPTGEVEVSSENTQFTIKPKDSFGYGRHTAMITVTDTDNNEYYSEVVFNVIYDSTQLVTNEADLRKFLSGESYLYPEVTMVKLSNDITVDDDWLPIHPVDGKTFDLNGQTLTVRDHIGLIFGNDTNEQHANIEFTITDSSSGKTGRILGQYNENLLRISREYYGYEDNVFTLNIEGGTYESPHASWGIFDIFLGEDWDTTHNDIFTLNISDNAIFKLNPANADNQLIYLPGEDSNENISKDNLKINLADMTVSLIGDGGLTTNANLYGYTVDDVISEDYQIIYPTYVDEIVGSQVATRTTELDDIKLPNMSGALGYQTIKVERIEGFRVTAPTFADNLKYGYSAVAAQPITIETIGDSPRTVESVTVNDPGKFTVNGNTKPTIAVGGTDNTSFTIAPATNLGAGNHDAIITVEDSSGNKYTTQVRFVVGKADITPSVSITGWTYGEYNGETNAPSVTGNTGNGAVTYHYVGVTPTVYDSSVAPMNEDVGTYKVQAHIAESDNYAEADCEATFAITKKVVSFDSSKISFNNKVYNMSSGTAYNIYDTVLDIPTSHYTKNINWVPETEKVGTHKATVTFTINSHYEDNYAFENGTNTFTTGEYSYQISTAMTTVETTAEYTDNEEIVKGTSLNLAKYVSLNYDSALKALLEPTNNSNLAGRLEYALVDEPAGVTISGSTLSVGNSVATGTTIKINVSYPGWDMYDVDGTPELSAASPISIYVKVVNKPKHTFDKTPDNKNMVYGDVLENLYTVTSESGVAVSYTSSDPSIVEILSAETNYNLKAKKYSATPVIITVTAPETASHSETSITYQVNVAKRTLNVEVGDYFVNKIYDGTTDAGANVGRPLFGNFIEGDNIYVEGDPAPYTNPNTHSEKVIATLSLEGTDKENYQLPFATIEVDAYIRPKTIVPVAVYTDTATYTGSAIEPIVTLKVTDDGPTLDATEYSLVYANNVEVGTNTGTITISPTEMNLSLETQFSNYTWEPVTKNFSITKAAYPGTVPAIAKNVVEQKAATYYISYADLGLSNELTNVTYTVSSPDGTFVTAASNDSDNSRISYTVASKVAGTNGSFKINVSSKNHQDAEITVTVTAVSKIPVVISGLEFPAKTYDGSPIVQNGTLVVDNPDYDVADLECLYTGSHSYSASTPPTNAGNYTLTCRVPESDDDYVGEKTWNFTISKATPTYSVPTGLNGLIGNQLNSITFEDTRFSWKTPTTPLVAGTHSYQATFTPEDANNYNIVNDININVYTKNKYGVTNTVIGGNGTISANLTNIVEGTSQDITFSPNTGYMIETVLVDEVDKTNQVSGNKITLTVNSDMTVKVSYKKIPFNLIVNDVQGATIEPSELVGTVIVEHGDTKVLTIRADHGYNLKSIKVNNVEKIAELSSDNKLTLSNITTDTNVVVVVEKIVYEVTEGDNLKTKDTSKLRFRFDADYSKFIPDGEVYVDGSLIDDTKYTSEEGSTIITLTEEYANSLSKDRQHSLKIVFNDGGEANTNFTIQNPTANPQTSDNIITYISLFIVSILGVASAIIFGKKKINIKK